MDRCSSLKSAKRDNCGGLFNQEIKASLWSELQVDLLKEIMGRLDFPDQVCFGAVCKNWLHSIYQKQPAYALPWVVRFTFCNEGVRWHLYEPSSSFKPFAVDNILTENWSSILCEWKRTFSGDWRENTTCKFGWVLFSREEGFTCTKFLLFSPFTKKFMTLPHLNHPKLKKCKTITSFSAEPNSPDCLFFVFQKCGGKKIAISTLGHGDDNWTSLEFDRKSIHGFHIKKAVYIKGSFYMVSKSGKLAAYKVACKEWNVIASSKFPDNFEFGWEEKLLESNGELLLVSVGGDRVNQPSNCNGCIIKFDWSKMDWVWLKSLGDQALFLGLNCFSVSVVRDEEARNIAKKIYYLIDFRCMVYSLEDGNLLECEDSGVKNWDKGNEIVNGRAIWIQPHDHLVKLPR